jgi:restriction endonuclease Mrr
VSRPAATRAGSSITCTVWPRAPSATVGVVADDHVVFTKGAQDYVRAIPKPITLVDGAKLARLMIEHASG